MGLGVSPYIVIPGEGIYNHRVYIGIMDGFLAIRELGEGINLTYFITSSNGLEVDGHSHVGKVDVFLTASGSCQVSIKSPKGFRI